MFSTHIRKTALCVVQELVAEVAGDIQSIVASVLDGLLSQVDAPEVTVTPKAMLVSFTFYILFPTKLE
jgi:hypothetical protein|tara:strand:+ start:14 stop:217 length:204 start_codon:yes stop_codon:yes gene_type:complete